MSAGDPQGGASPLRVYIGAALVRVGLVGLAVWLGCSPALAAGDAARLGGIAAAGSVLLPLEYLGARKFGAARALAAHYIANVALLSALLLSGGSQAELFAPLYLLIAAAAGASLGLVPGLGTGTLSALAYPVVVRLTHTGLAGNVEWTRVTVLSLTFLCVGILAGMLAQQAQSHLSAREDAERRLRRAQLDVENIVLNMSSGLLTVEGDGVSLCNRAGADILGLDPEALRGRSLGETLPEGLREFAELMDAALHRGRTRQRAEIDVTRADGTRVPLGISTSILREADGKRRGAIAVFQDLTEARLLERAARRQETLAAIGGLSAGVAHEIRNCLNPITGSIEMLRGEFEGESEAQRLMDLITREGERLNQFIGELLAFARVEELHPSKVDLGMLLEEVSRLLECHPRRKPVHQIRCEVGTQVLARVDGEHLRRVFVNLGLNALEAMDGPGTLTLRLVPPDPETQGGAVAMDFEDTGTGIRAEDLPKVFDPFFTTKEDGTGLGLALARQVVERHGGRIEVASTVGQGTRMRVVLPALSGAAPIARAA